MRKLFRVLFGYHCRHDWSVWSDLVRTHNGHKQQWRLCMKCNMAEFYTLPWDEQSELSEVNKLLSSAKIKTSPIEHFLNQTEGKI